MTVTITFQLEDADLEHFRQIMARARASAEKMTLQEIVRAARQRSMELRTSPLPTFVADRLDGLDEVIAMALDEDWLLPEQDAGRLVDALAYFCEPEDLIPDDIPGIGLLDDAIMMELVIRELQPELEAHRDFAAFRDKESARRKAEANQAAVTRADWLDAKRAELHDQARRRRSARSQSGLFSSLFSIL